MSIQDAELTPIKVSHGYMLFNRDPMGDGNLPVGFTESSDVAQTFVAFGLADDYADSLIVTRADDAK